MIFQEKKIETGYHYKVEDIFGIVDINSPIKLKGEVLDDVVHFLLKQNIQAEAINGSVLLDKDKKDKINYKFVKRPMWDDDDEEDEDICINSHTSKKRRARELIQTSVSTMIGLSWLARFVGAFRQAWKNQAPKK